MAPWVRLMRRALGHQAGQHRGHEPTGRRDADRGQWVILGPRPHVERAHEVLPEVVQRVRQGPLGIGGLTSQILSLVLW